MQRESALGQSRLEQIGRIHRTARSRAGADHRMDLVDEENGLFVLLDLFHHLLEAFFEIAAIACAGQQRAHVESIDRRALEHFRNFALDDFARQTFGDRRLADAGIADQQRIVLLAAAQHLDGAQDFGLATDQRIDLAILRLVVEVHAISLESGFLFLGIRAPCCRGSTLLRSASSSMPRGVLPVSAGPGRLAMPWLM